MNVCNVEESIIFSLNVSSTIRKYTTECNQKSCTYSNMWIIENHFHICRYFQLIFSPWTYKWCRMTNAKCSNYLWELIETEGGTGERERVRVVYFNKKEVTLDVHTSYSLFVRRQMRVIKNSFSSKYFFFLAVTIKRSRTHFVNKQFIITPSLFFFLFFIVEMTFNRTLKKKREGKK